MISLLLSRLTRPRLSRLTPPILRVREIYIFFFKKKIKKSKNQIFSMSRDPGFENKNQSGVCVGVSTLTDRAGGVGGGGGCGWWRGERGFG